MKGWLWSTEKCTYLIEYAIKQTSLGKHGLWQISRAKQSRTGVQQRATPAANGQYTFLSWQNALQLSTKS